MGELVTTAKVTAGDLAVEFLDNAQSPQILSGVDRLFNVKSAPDFDAFDPNDPPVVGGTELRAHHFRPQRSGELVRTAQRDLSAVSSG